MRWLFTRISNKSRHLIIIILTSSLSAAFAARPSVVLLLLLLLLLLVGTEAAAATVGKAVIMGPIEWWMFKNFFSVTFILVCTFKYIFSNILFLRGSFCSRRPAPGLRQCFLFYLFAEQLLYSTVNGDLYSERVRKRENLCTFMVKVEYVDICHYVHFLLYHIKTIKYVHYLLLGIYCSSLI